MVNIWAYYEQTIGFSNMKITLSTVSQLFQAVAALMQELEAIHQQQQQQSISQQPPSQPPK